MDEGRAHDLKHIQTQLDRKDLSTKKRHRLEMVKEAVVEQSKDRETAELRRRLIRANQAGDSAAVAKIQGQLRKKDAEAGFDRRVLR